MAIGIAVHRARAQRLLRQRHHVEIGVLVIGGDAHRAGMHDVADVAQIFAEIRRRLRRRPEFRAGRRARRLRRRRRRGVGLPPAENAEPSGVVGGWRSGCGGCVLLGRRRRRTRRVRVLHVEPLVAFRRTAAAARTIGIAERQSHLVGEVSTQEVDEVGAVGLQATLAFVFIAAEIVGEEVARLVAQHVIPGLPVQVLIGRRVEQLGDPGREQRLVGVIPAAFHLPEFSGRNRYRRGLGRADGDLVLDLAAIRRRAVERQRGVPFARRRLIDLGEPEIGRAAVPVGRFGDDAAIGPGQRDRAVERLFADGHDPQRRALPWREWRRQHLEPGLRAGIGRFGRHARDGENERGCCDSGKPAGTAHIEDPLRNPENPTGPAASVPVLTFVSWFSRHGTNVEPKDQSANSGAVRI